MPFPGKEEHNIWFNTPAFNLDVKWNIGKLFFQVAF